MKKLLSIAALSFLLAACGGGQKNEGNSEEQNEDTYESIHGNAKKADEGKGIGEVKEVTLHTPLEQERVDRGKAIYEMKCQACHRLDDQRVVGPGWKNVTTRRKPEWIMNMITNVDVMLAEDAEAQKLLELCLTRMPNQNVSIGDARDVLEFMRQNDGEK